MDHVNNAPAETMKAEAGAVIAREDGWHSQREEEEEMKRMPTAGH